VTVSRFAVLLLVVAMPLAAFAQTPADRPDLQGSAPAPSTASEAPQIQLPKLDTPPLGPRKTAASEAPKTAISNGTPIAAGDITAGTFGSLQGGGLFTFPSGIAVNGSAPVAGTGAVMYGTLSRGVDAQITGTTSYNLALTGTATGAGTVNYGAYVGAANATGNNIGLVLAANTPPAGAGNFAILSQSQAQSSLAGNLGIGTSAPAARLDLASTTQVSERIRLSGQEYFQAGLTDTQGVSMILGVNRTGNRQLWFGDSAAVAPNTTNPVLRFVFGSLFPSTVIDAISTDGTTLKNISLVPWGGSIGIGTLAPLSRLQVVSTANGIADGIRISGFDFATSGSYLMLNKNSGTGTAATLQGGDNNSWTPLALNPSGGNVGVGTSAPTAQFQVTGSGYTTMAVGKRTDSPTISGLIALESSSGTWNMQNSSGDLILYSGATLATTTGTERLRLPSTGGIKFPDGTTQTTAFSSGAVSPTAMSPGTFGGSGTYTFPGNVTTVGAIKGNSHLSFMPWTLLAPAVGTTGYIRLMTPIAANESNMFSLHIYGYGYQNLQSMDIRCGGYAYTAAGLINATCTATGTDLPVQITTEPVNSVNMVVVRIGTLSNTWYYPHFSVEYDGWQVKDPAGFIWSVVNAVPAGAPALANMNYVASSNVNGGALTVGTTAGDTTVRMTVNGGVQVNGKLTANQVLGAVYQDVAEWVPAKGQLPAGTVVVLNRDKNNEVQASLNAYDTAVAGVVSAMPGLLLGVEAPEKAQIATTGRVKVKVDATAHPIKVGDLLVTSDKPGMAMFSQPVDVSGIKFHRPGTLIGKALEPLEGGEGEILVLLSLQ
jgi:hypothetical protein